MKKKVKTSPSAITHEEKKPVLERFWPTGVIASFAVAAAVGLHIAGYTTAPVKTEAAAEALALEAEEAEDAGADALIARWEEAHPNGVPAEKEDALSVSEKEVATYISRSFEAEEAEDAGADALIARWEEAHPNGVPAEKEDALSVSEKEVATYISRSYRVPMAEAEQLTTWAVEIGAGFDVDPLLILAVAAVESSFNPKAKSGAGAEGLMQVMTRVHAEKFHAFGGPQAALEPYPSMVVGTSILSRLITRTGSVQKALKFYFGAANQPSDGGYSERVFKERSRMRVAAGGDSDHAVQLSRKKRTGPEFAQTRAGVKQLGFREWTEVTGIVETKLAQNEGKVRQLQASSDDAQKRSAEPLENAPGDAGGPTRLN